MIDLLYPPRCPLCGEVTAKEGPHKKCLDKTFLIGNDICMKCGKPLGDPGEELCADCKRTEHHFRSGRAVWVYDDIMEESIAAYKFLFKKEYGSFYARAMYLRYKDWIRSIKPDCMIPVPISSRKLRHRGFNQAYIIAKELSRSTGIPVYKNILTRNKNTAPQKDFSPELRLLNLMKAFTVGNAGYNIGRVLLIDDIYTTGSTIEACTRVLLKNGIKEVFFLTICIGIGIS